MPAVPEYNNKQIKIIYNPKNPNAIASLKQQALILTLCERRKIEPPDVQKLTTGQAAAMISAMLDN